MGLLRVSLTQSSRERRGLQAIRPTLLKASLKGLLGRASNGLRIGIIRWFMGGVDFLELLVICYLGFVSYAW